jgi:hypothetical protein
MRSLTLVSPSPGTGTIYAKLYPSRLIEEYRKTVRGLYNSY